MKRPIEDYNVKLERWAAEGLRSGELSDQMYRFVTNTEKPSASSRQAEELHLANPKLAARVPSLALSCTTPGVELPFTITQWKTRRTAATPPHARTEAVPRRTPASASVAPLTVGLAQG